MAEIQRRTTSGGELGSRDRRKSGIFFFNRSFKNSKSSSSSKGESDDHVSTPTTPKLGPAKDFELKRTASGHTIPGVAQTATVTAEAGGVLSSSPKSASHSLGEATQKLPGQSTDAISTEDLPTPPHTPGHSSHGEAANDTTTEASGTADTEESKEATEEAPEEPEVPDVPEMKTVSYHENADLGVKVREADGTEAVYSVSSSILKHASPAWKESIPPQTSTLDLTSDPAPGLEVIFSIAHYKFQDVPQQVNNTQLHDITLVADKYSTLHLLPPFLKPWLASAASSPTGDADTTLVTSYLLGQAPPLTHALPPTAAAASLAPDGTLLDARGRPWHEQPVSHELIELLATTRARVIERIIRAVSTPITKLLNPEAYPDEDIRYCHAAGGDEAAREECEQLQLGSAIMGLTKARLWPAPEAARIRASPVELARAYRDIRIRRYQTPGLRFQEEAGQDAHAGCGFGHLAEIDVILQEPVTLTPGVIEHLQSRAQKLGISSGVVSEEYFPQQVVEVPDIPVRQGAVRDGLVDGEQPSTETVVAGDDVKEDS